MTYDLLDPYLDRHPEETRTKIAGRVGISLSFLSQICRGTRDCPNTIGARIQRETGGSVTQTALAELRERVKPLEEARTKAKARKKRAAERRKAPAGQAA